MPKSSENKISLIMCIINEAKKAKMVTFPAMDSSVIKSAIFFKIDTYFLLIRLHELYQDQFEILAI